MKKMILISILLITLVFGNPIDTYQFYINEFFVTDSNWVIELPNCFQYNPDSLKNYMDDTLKIASSTDSVFYPVSKVRFLGDWCCLYSDSVESNFSINKTGDDIDIFLLDSADFDNRNYTYYCEFNFSESYKNCSLSRSEIWHPYYKYRYYYDSTPTLGAENDSSGGSGLLNVIILDTLGNDLTLGYCFYWDSAIKTISSGDNIKLLATYYTIYFYPENGSTLEKDINIYPDSTTCLTITVPTGPSSIDKKNDLASNYTLFQNYPNPFNPTTKFKFCLHQKTYTELSVFDLSGRLIEKLVNETLDAGEYNLIWNANKYASGIYIYQLRTNSATLRKKCLLVK